MSFARFLKPRSIAGFGGFAAEELIRQCDLMGYLGDLWPVHPKKEEILGRKVFRSVGDLPGSPDAAYVAVNRNLTIDIVRDLAAREAGGAICFATGFTEAGDVASALAGAIDGIADLDRDRMLLFGGWESASRGAGAVMQMVAEKLGITEQFQGVDVFEAAENDQFLIKERIEGGSYLVSECSGCPILLGWATGNLPEPKNNPQVGMMNMPKVMPALQKAANAEITTGGIDYRSVSLPKQGRETRVEKDLSSDEVAKEISEWLKQ